MNFIKIIKERKIIDGKLYRRYFIDSEGKEIGVPQNVYVSHCLHYNYISVRLDKMKQAGFGAICTPFQDKQTQEQALKKSIKIINTLSKDASLTSSTTRQKRQRIELPPAFDIDASELPTGVMISVQTTRSPALSVGVNYFDATAGRFKKKNFYVGTLNTWKENYAKKLQEAITFRQESLKLHLKLTKGTKS